MLKLSQYPNTATLERDVYKETNVFSIIRNSVEQTLDSFEGMNYMTLLCIDDVGDILILTVITPTHQERETDRVCMYLFIIIFFLYVVNYFFLISRKLIKKFLKMSLWIDKHRPATLAKLSYHLDQAQHLKRLVSNTFCQNIF